MKGTGNVANIGEARRMVESHRHKEHHEVAKHSMGGSVPRTPKADSATEPHPKDHEDRIVDG